MPLVYGISGKMLKADFKTKTVKCKKCNYTANCLLVNERSTEIDSLPSLADIVNKQVKNGDDLTKKVRVQHQESEM